LTVVFTGQETADQFHKDAHKSPPLPIDGERFFFGIEPKKPMFSAAPFSDGVADGIMSREKYFLQKNQCVMMPVNNRVGMTGRAVEWQ
jgi:hypothetical protein